MWPGVVIGLLQTRQEYSFLSLGLWPCSLFSRFLLHAVVRDVGPEGSAPDDKPEGPAADDKPEGPGADNKLEGPAPDDKPEGPGADDKLDRFDKSCALVPVEAVGDTVEPARVPVASFLLRTRACPVVSSASGKL